MGLTDQQLGELAVSHLPSKEQAAMAVAIALAENSGKNPNAMNLNSNGSIDTGLWQINSVHKRDHPEWTVQWLKVPANNATAMSVVSGNGQNWQPWTTFKSGAYEQYKERAVNAVGGVRWAPGTDVPGVGDVFDAATASANALTGIARFFEGILDPIVSGAAWLGNPANWVRILQVTGGIGLGIVALNMAFKPQMEKLGGEIVRAVGTKGLA